jgi:integrase
MKPRLPQYVSGFADRHGKMRYRFRKTGSEAYYFANQPGTTGFAEEYRACLEGAERPRMAESPSATPGSLNSLALKFYQSPEWMGANEATRHAQRLVLDRFLAKHGHRMVRDLHVEHVDHILSAARSTPSAANKLRKLLRRLMSYGVKLRMRRDNPVDLTKGFSEKTDGYHSWTDDELEAFERRHPIGTKAHTAYAIMLYTGQRRSDACVFGAGHVDGGQMRVRHLKTGHYLVIPVHWQLKRALDAAKSGHLTYVVTDAGKPYTSDSFGNWFRDRCDEAGLKHCSAHGLRKAAGRRLAEAGCTVHQIMAILGVSIKIAMVYTRAADQIRLASEGMAKQSQHDHLSNLNSGLAKSPVNPPKGKGK